MRAGRMDRYLTIQKKVNSKDNDGATIETWSTRTYCWGEKRNLNMSERLQASAVESNISARYYVRYDTDISVQDRIVDGSDTYEILGILEIGRKKGLELIAGTI